MSVVRLAGWPNGARIAAGDDLDVQVAPVDGPVPVGGEDPLGPGAGEVDGGALRRQGQLPDLDGDAEVAGVCSTSEVEVVVGELVALGASRDRPHGRCSSVGAHRCVEAGPPELTDVPADDRLRRRREAPVRRRREDERRGHLDGGDVAGRFHPLVAGQLRPVGAGIDAQGVGGEVEQVADGELGPG